MVAEHWLSRPLGRAAYLGLHLPLWALLARYWDLPPTPQRRWLLARVGGVVLGLMWAVARRRWLDWPRPGMPEALLVAGLGLLALSLAHPAAERWLGLFLLGCPWLGLLAPSAGLPAPAWSGLWRPPLYGVAALVTGHLAWRLS